MPWPKGRALPKEHKERIREGVLRTVKIRRRPRTREQRLADITEDPRSVMKRRFTKAPKQQGRFMAFLASKGRATKAPKEQAKQETPKHLGIPGLRPRSSAPPMPYGLIRHRELPGAERQVFV